MTGSSAIGSVQVLGTAVFSTHHASAHDVLAEQDRPFTSPTYGLLVGRARRFTSLVTQMHIEVCGALNVDPGQLSAAVFATCHGEIQTAEKLIADFREASMVSSARFAMSVHNTPSGVYSVATGSHAPTTTVTGANAIAAGWLEAALAALDLDAGRTVLLSIADEPVPAVFQGPAGQVGVAAAFLLGPASAGGGQIGRRAQLALVPAAPSDGEVDALQVLARAADASTGDAAAVIALGPIQLGAALELRFPAKEVRP
jgi:hypothetical protein